MLYMDPNGNFPRFAGDVSIDNPNFLEDKILPKGWVQVQETPNPEIGENQTYEYGQPEKIDGTWVNQWVIRDLTDEEIERRDAPKNAKSKLLALGLTELEISALVLGLLR